MSRGAREGFFSARGCFALLAERASKNFPRFVEKKQRQRTDKKTFLGTGRPQEADDSAPAKDGRKRGAGSGAPWSGNRQFFLKKNLNCA